VPSLRNVVFQVNDRTMDNVQNCDSYINILSAQTYRSESFTAVTMSSTAYLTVTPCSRVDGRRQGWKCRFLDESRWNVL
jgi:hypothetical protein